MFRNASKLIECLRKWRSVKTTFYSEDSRLFLSVTIVSGVIYCFGIIENFGSHWQVIRDTYFARNHTIQTSDGVVTDTGKITLAENYFRDEYPQFIGLIPYNLAAAIAFYIGDKLAVYAWNFADILIAVIGRAMYKRFQLHYKHFKEKLDNDPSLFESIKKSKF